MSELMKRIEYVLARTSNEVARLEDVRILRAALWDAREGLRWIPVTERLPETSGNYRTTISIEPIGANGVLYMLSFDYFNAKTGQWQGRGSELVAWKEKPAPYTPPKEEANE